MQRVAQASVTSEGVLVGEIGDGLCVLLGITSTDTELLADKMAERIFNVRIIDDADGVMNLSVAQIGRAHV